jgi:hypothetical protein
MSCIRRCLSPGQHPAPNEHAADYKAGIRKALNVPDMAIPAADWGSHLWPLSISSDVFDFHDRGAGGCRSVKTTTNAKIENKIIRAAHCW